MIKQLKNNYAIIQGDAYDLIKKIPDKSIDLIITDPPYDITISKKRTNKNRIDRSLNSLENQLIDANVTQSINEEILDEFMRILKKPNIYIWCNKKQIPMYLNYFVTKHKCAFDILVWIKTNPIPIYGSNYMNDKEYCLYFRKGIKLNTNYETGKTYWITPTNVADKKEYGHPTIKRLDIIEQLVNTASKENDIILDPFIGSGTTAVASLKNKRRCIGFELNPNYIPIINQRINSIYSTS